MWSISEVKEKGKSAFKANYWLCVAVSFVMAMIGGAQGGSARLNDSDIDKISEELDGSGISDAIANANINWAALIGVIVTIVLVAVIIGVAIDIFIKNVVQVGKNKFFLNNAIGESNFSDIIYGFKNSYLRNVLILFQVDLFVWLWSLLFVIPGIIKSYEYMMVPYIIADDPEIDSKGAFAKSRAMMTGNKWKTFTLQLSFIGWGILTIWTCGIVGIFYLNPYYNATMAELYRALKGDTVDATVDATVYEA